VTSSQCIHRKKVSIQKAKIVHPAHARENNLTYRKQVQSASSDKNEKGLDRPLCSLSDTFGMYSLSQREEKTSMFPTKLFQFSAWAAIISGLLIIIKKLVVDLLLPPNPATNAIGSFGIFLGLFTLTGIYLYQREASGRLGLIGYLVNWFGLAFVSGVDYAKNYILPYLSKSELQALLAGPTKLVFLSCAIFFLAGVILFSVASLRARVLPPLAVLLYLIGFTFYSLSFLLPDIVVRIAQVGGALGIIWLGYTLWTAFRKTTTLQSNQAIHA
jgi:hypothetical protein